MKGRLSTSKTVTQLQLTVEELKKSIRDVVRERSAILGPPVQKGDWPDVFVLMPFISAMQPVYEDHIKKIAAKLKVRIGRADDFFSAGSVIQDIWSAIHAARIVVADCTGRNPNVFYGIGLAHAIGRPTILISQALDDVPVDLRHLRIISYVSTPLGMKTFEKHLIETIMKSM